MEGSNFKKELIRRFRDNKATKEELEVLFHLIEKGEIEKDLEDVMDESSFAEESTGKIITLFKRSWFRIAAAAVLILAATGIYLLLNKTPKLQQVVVKQQPANDISPGGNKAVLILANGSTIILDSAANGLLSQQGNTKILKLENGQLAYSLLNEEPREILYNTITTPRGGQYQLTLADGSKVWLNAASSLRFPASFAGKERKVELTGEAYFEVAKNASMPFKVDVAGKGEVEVLGTHFNINAYTDEASINTTLLEGSVKVTGLQTQDSRLLTPGQQAQLNASGQISVDKNPNVEEVMAWKNGKFQFGEAADIPSIMRQISRWYDVEVEYKGKITEHIGGTISRDVNVSKVFEMLEMTGSVKFQVIGKKVTVLPQKK